MREGQQATYRGGVLTIEDYPKYVGQTGVVEQVSDDGDWCVVLMTNGERIDGMVIEFYTQEEQ